MSYAPVPDQPKTASEFFKNPPIRAEERVKSQRSIPNRKTDFLSMLEFAEDYADYICDYEKTFDYQRKVRK